MSDLYSDVMIAHSKKPRNCIQGKPFDTNGWLTVAGKFPSCAENIIMHFLIKDKRIIDVKWDGMGSAVMKASASISSDHIRGMLVEHAYLWAERVFMAFGGQQKFADSDLGDLAALESVKSYPRRVKSAILPAHTVKLMVARVRGKNGRI